MFWFKKTLKTVTIDGRKPLYTYLYFGWLFIFNNDNILFYIKTQIIWLSNCVFKFKSLHHKTQSSNKEIQENKLQSLQQFWWIYTEWNTMRWIFHTEKNILCFSWNSKKSSVEIPNTNFDWFTRNDTSWNDYFIHTNLLCFT